MSPFPRYRQPAFHALNDGVFNKWFLIIGGCLLAFGAAFANTGLVLRTGTSVSHLTGDISRFNIDITQWSQAAFDEIRFVSCAAIGFLAEATVSGFVVHHPTIDISRPYGRSIGFIGLLFFGSSLLVASHPALAIGFQNALATHYRGLVLRTTHLTGMFTNLGVSFGMRLNGHAIPLWKIAVPAVLIVSFCVGGLAAALLETFLQNSIRTAGIAYCIAGMAWSIWKHRIFLRGK